ncbi:hypothetical protein, partial [Deinococcus sp.]|uniref:hypothetical protein n=1 Tax=Deinococcus sp. TaxID=47478 RepID=UPI002869DFB1
LPQATESDHVFLHTALPNGSEVDLHEVYWAPLCPDVGGMDVIRWLRRQWQVPFLRLSTDWRRLARLRRGVLGQALATGRINQTDAAPLLTHYTSFQKDAACKKYPQGTFDDFLQWLNAQGAPAQVPAARIWRAQSHENDLVAAGAVLSLVLMTLVFAVLTFEAGSGLLKLLGAPALVDWTKRYGLDVTSTIDQAFVTPLVVMTFLVSLVWLVGVRPFFQTFVGDVVRWAVYHETNVNFAVRRAILSASEDVFRTVLTLTPQYDRIIVMAHSLGSVIAHDTLLRLSGENPAPLGLHRISHVLTYGSPIDKFAYFFEAQQGQTSRYENVINDLRGTVFSAPFTPSLRWENFYEEGDPISGTIHTAGTEDTLLQVKNVYTANALVALVAPNHTGYVNNKMVLSRVWEALTPGVWTPEETKVDVMAHTRWMRQMYAVILAIPWTLLAAYLMHGAHVLRMKQGEVPAWLAVWSACGLAVVVWGASALFKLRWLAPVALLPAALAGIAALALLSPADPATLWEGSAALLRWSMMLGLAVPTLLVLALLLITDLRAQSRKRAGLAKAQVSEREPPTLPVILVLLAALVLAGILRTVGDHPWLPWWWWRTTFLYATFALLAVSAAQFIWAKRLPKHMLEG